MTELDIEWLHQGRLRELREAAGDLGVVKSGNVEELRKRLIIHLHLPEIDFGPAGLKELALAELTDICRLFGIKRSGSIKEKRQRIWLHVHHDPGELNIDVLDAMSRDELHDLCAALGLPRSGSKTQLFGRVAGVLSAQDGGWGQVKKSLRRPKPERRLIHDGRAEAVARLAQVQASDEPDPDAEPAPGPPLPAPPAPAAPPVAPPVMPAASTPVPAAAPAVASAVAEPRIEEDEARGRAPAARRRAPAATEVDPDVVRAAFAQVTAPEPTASEAVAAPVSVAAAIRETTPLPPESGTSDDGTAGLIAPATRDAARDAVRAYVRQHPDGWDHQQEASLRAALADLGLAMLDPRISEQVSHWLEEAAAHERANTEADAVRAGSPEAQARAENLALRHLELRQADLWASLREFLLVGDPSDVDDLASLVDTLRTQGFKVDLPAVRQRVERELILVQGRLADEARALDPERATWEDAAALAELETKRPELQARLEALIESGETDRVRLRHAYEAMVDELGIALESPAVSGRVHALFDLAVQLRHGHTSADPVLARRARAARLLQHRTGDLSEAERATLSHLAEDVVVLEQVVEAVLRRHDGAFGPAQQALLVRSLERRGINVNTPMVRPRIVAAAGAIAAELGFVDPAEIPELAALDGAPSHEREVMRNLRSLAQRLAADRNPAPVGAMSATEDDEPQRTTQVQRARQRLVDVDRLLDRVGGRSGQALDE